MPRYEVRLEAQDGSGHFRVVHLEAEDKAAARAACERAEFSRAAYQISQREQGELAAKYDVKSIDKLPKAAALDASEDEKAAFRALEVPDRARLHAHYQDRPYKVVSVKER